MSDQEQSSAADKSHEPTPQKLQKSREKGDVPYSSEVTAATTYAGFFIALIIVAGWSAFQLHATLSAFFHKPQDVGNFLFSQHESGFMSHTAWRVMAAMAPVFLFISVAAIASILSQRAFAFSLTKIKPKLSRLSPIDNAKQKYGVNGISEFLKSAAKLLAVLCILFFASKDRFFELPFLSGLPTNSIAHLLRREAIFFCGLITLAAFMIAAVDLPWRHFQYRNRLKMTHQELKEENKETEGDPILKNARRQRAETIATNRMMRDVPKADIILVNPSHYAVALQWKRHKDAAPICVAKGVDEIAARIRETAAASGVPIKRDPPTARSIYAVVDIGCQIKKEHYAAVSAAIHYADEIRKKWRKGYGS